MRRWNPLYNPTPRTSYSFYRSAVRRNPLLRRQPPPLLSPSLQITALWGHRTAGEEEEEEEEGGAVGPEDATLLWDFDSWSMMDDIMLQPRLFARRRRRNFSFTTSASFLRNDDEDNSDTARALASIMTQFMDDEIMNELGDLLLEEAELGLLGSGSSNEPPPISNITQEDMERMYPAGKQQEGSSAAKCIVCHDNIGTEEKVRVLDCKHVYHTDCIDEWCAINASCPICRRDIRKEEERE